MARLMTLPLLMAANLVLPQGAHRDQRISGLGQVAALSRTLSARTIISPSAGPT